MSTPSTSDLMRLARQIERCFDDDLKVMASRLETLEDDAYNVLAAQSFTPSEGNGFRAWCGVHLQPIQRCENEDHGDCSVTFDPDAAKVRPDPVGEAAIEDNKARAKLHAIKRKLEHIDKVVRELHVLLSPDVRKDTADERNAVRRENERPDGPVCDVCAYSKVWSVLHQPEKGRDLGPTDVGGKLDREHLLCTYHYKFVLRYHRLPNPTEEADHHAGRRVTVREPTAPSQPEHKFVKRLEAGLVDGHLSP